MEDRIFDILKERFNFEIERQYKIRDNISILISFCVLVITGLLLIFKNFYLLNNDLLSIFCYFLAVVLYLLLLFSMYFFWKSVFGYTYLKFPPPSKTLEDIKELKNYYNGDFFKDKSSEEKESLTNSHLTRFFKEYYIEITDINIANNDRRSKYLYLTHATLTIAVIILLLSLLPFSIKYVNYQNNINSNKEKISMPNNESKPEQKPIEKEPTKNPQPEPQKSPPEMLRESDDKPVERK